jgi:hypothetical protein
MRSHALLEDADKLVALAESVATALSKKQHELKMDSQIEALLRVSIGAATTSINMYLSTLAGATKSRLQRKYFVETRRHCRWTVAHLQRRVRYSIAYLSRVIGEKQLTQSVDDVPL